MATSPIGIAIRILEESHISPPSSSPPVNASLRLTFFDIPWLLLPPSQPLFFYHHSSNSSFTSTILPKLNHSLSLALLQFPPFAGKLATSRTGPATPEIFYSDGDSVRVTVAEATGYAAHEFDHLCGNNCHKDAHVFHQLVPTCLEVSCDGDIFSLCDCLAVQITSFPEARGFSIGFAYPRVVCDQRTFNNFLKAWASLCKFGDGGVCNGLQPSYSRASMLGRNGLEPILVNQWWDRGGKVATATGMRVSSAGIVRATFLMGPADIENTRNWIEAQCRKKNSPRPVLLSAYVVVCAFVWACLAKAHKSESNQGSPVYFGFIAGGLSRLPYRVPANYFGNCVAFGRAEVATPRDLVGEGGLEAAAAAIAETVKRLDGDVLGGAEKWIEEWEKVIGSDLQVNVVGSPKVDLYETDFGWGRPRKIEEVGIDGTGGVSLCESREVKGGIEIGVVLTKPEMDAFSKLFWDGLEEFSLDASVAKMK